MSLLFDSPIESVRPWGKFVEFTQNEPTTVKIITVNPHEALSLQRHHKREEFWFVISGLGKVEIDGEEFKITPGSKFVIPKESTHRVTAGSLPVMFLEISTGDFDEGDIVRLEDKYGRISK